MPADATALQSAYRGRLAPSPTGYLHVGHARTFWTAFERALAAGGTLAMRMEDLDLQRSRAIYTDAALEDVRWLGIRWQEGPDVGGPFGPYVQSQRHGLYAEAWHKLCAAGWLYPCRCSRKDLEAAVSAPHEGAAGAPGAEDDEPMYPGTCRPGAPVPGADRANDTAAGNDAAAGSDDAHDNDAPGDLNWRFAVPDGEAVEFVDGNLGPQRFIAGRDFGDFIAWRRDGTASYQLACVVDDAAMRVTEVVRGADLLKSTARQILLNRALGYANPGWFHCDLVLDRNGRRLAKRHDVLSVRSLREQGWTPERVLSEALPNEKRAR